jgi:copper chaperone
MQTSSFFVTGMQCGGCANKLSLALRTLNGVDDVQISLASGEVTIVYDPALVSRGSLIFASKSDGRSTGYFPMVFDPSSISE